MAANALRQTEQKAAVKKWQLAENEGRQAYTTGRATSSDDGGLAWIELSYANTVADRQMLYNDEIAELAKMRDLSYALFQTDYWTLEVGHRNQNRSAKAGADVAFWTERETQRLVAHQFIDDAFDIDNYWIGYRTWSEYLVEAAVARINALNAINTSYWSSSPSSVTLTSSRNASEALHQAELSAGYELRENALTEARKTHALALSSAANNNARSVALAEANYLRSMSGSARQYLAKRLDNAEAEPYDFYRDDANAFTVRYKAIATADYTLAQRTLNADKALAEAKATRENDYRAVESNAYVSSITRWSSFDRDFTVLHSQAMVAAASAAQSYSPSPWLGHDADVLASERNDALAMQQQAHTFRVTSATSHSTEEKTAATAESNDQKANITSSHTQGTNTIIANLKAVNEHANRVIKLAEEKQYTNVLPEQTHPSAVTYSISLSTLATLGGVVPPVSFSLEKGWMNYLSGEVTNPPSSPPFFVFGEVVLPRIDFYTTPAIPSIYWPIHIAPYEPIIADTYWDFSQEVDFVADFRESQIEIYKTTFDEFDIYTYQVPRYVAVSKATSASPSQPPLLPGAARMPTTPTGFHSPFRTNESGDDAENSEGDTTAKFGETASVSTRMLPIPSLSSGRNFDSDEVSRKLELFDSKVNSLFAQHGSIVTHDVVERPDREKYIRRRSSSSTESGFGAHRKFSDYFVREIGQRDRPSIFDKLEVRANPNDSSLRVAKSVIDAAMQEENEINRTTLLVSYPADTTTDSDDEKSNSNDESTEFKPIGKTPLIGVGPGVNYPKLPRFEQRIFKTYNWSARQYIRDNVIALKVDLVFKIVELLHTTPPRDPYGQIIKLSKIESEQVANFLADIYIQAVDEFLKTHTGARPEQGTRNRILDRAGISNEFNHPWCDDWAKSMLEYISDRLDDRKLRVMVAVGGKSMPLGSIVRIHRYYWKGMVREHNYTGITPWGYTPANPPTKDGSILIFDPWVILLPKAYWTKEHPYPPTGQGIKPL